MGKCCENPPPLVKPDPMSDWQAISGKPNIGPYADSRRKKSEVTTQSENEQDLDAIDMLERFR